MAGRGATGAAGGGTKLIFDEEEGHEVRGAGRHEPTLPMPTVTSAAGRGAKNKPSRALPFCTPKVEATPTDGAPAAMLPPWLHEHIRCLVDDAYEYAEVAEMRGAPDASIVVPALLVYTTGLLRQAGLVVVGGGAESDRCCTSQKPPSSQTGGYLWPNRYSAPLLPTTDRAQAWLRLTQWLSTWTGKADCLPPSSISAHSGGGSAAAVHQVTEELLISLTSATFTESGLRRSQRVARREEAQEALRAKQKGYFVGGVGGGGEVRTGTTSNIAVISGPLGAGTTSLVQAACESRSYKLFEINMATKRSAAVMSKIMAEATQCRQLTVSVASLTNARDELDRLDHQGRLERHRAAALAEEADARREAEKAKQMQTTNMHGVKDSASKKPKTGNTISKEAIANFFAKKVPKPAASSTAASTTSTAAQRGHDAATPPPSHRSGAVNVDDGSSRRRTGAKSSRARSSSTEHCVEVLVVDEEGTTGNRGEATPDVATRGGARPAVYLVDDVTTPPDLNLRSEMATGGGASSPAVGSDTKLSPISPLSSSSFSVALSRDPSSPVCGPSATKHPMVPAASAAPTTLSVVLVESGDVVLDDEPGFHASLREVAAQSRCPVVVTVNEAYDENAMDSTFGEGVPYIRLDAVAEVILVVQLAVIAGVESCMAASVPGLGLTEGLDPVLFTAFSAKRLLSFVRSTPKQFRHARPLLLALQLALCDYLSALREKKGAAAGSSSLSFATRDDVVPTALARLEFEPWWPAAAHIFGRKHPPVRVHWRTDFVG